MQRRPHRKFETFRRVATYIIAVIAVLVLVTAVVLFILGYRIDSENGLEQGALLQFNTQPTGASVTVDGHGVSGRTPNKSTVFAGSHVVTMTEDGYLPWTKTVKVTAGTLTWLDYGILIPAKLTTTPLTSYATMAGALASEKGESLLLQPDASVASFQLVDLTQASPAITTLTLPGHLYSEPVTAGTTHQFQLMEFDDSGRYVLVKHTYTTNGTAQTEWLVLDTQDPGASENVTRQLDVSLSDAHFAGSGDSTLYGLAIDGSIRKLDLNSSTLSGPLVSNATAFSVYDGSVITYTGTDPNDSSRHVAGLYQDGDSQSVIIQSAATASLHIAATRYYNNEYLAVANGNGVQIYKGSFPHTSSDVAKLQTFGTLTLTGDSLESLGFSPEGTYLLAQNATNFASYDLEHQQAYSGTIQGDDNGQPPLHWLNQATLYATTGDSLTVREFDGANFHTINSAALGSVATLSPNDRFLYSITKLAGGDYQLQRVSLLLN